MAPERIGGFAVMSSSWPWVPARAGTDCPSVIINANPSHAGLNAPLPWGYIAFYLVSNIILAAYAVVLVRLIVKKRKSAIAHNAVYGILTIIFLAAWHFLGMKSLMARRRLAARRCRHPLLRTVGQGERNPRRLSPAGLRRPRGRRRPRRGGSEPDEDHALGVHLRAARLNRGQRARLQVVGGEVVRREAGRRADGRGVVGVARGHRRVRGPDRERRRRPRRPCRWSGRSCTRRLDERSAQAVSSTELDRRQHVQARPAAGPAGTKICSLSPWRGQHEVAREPRRRPRDHLVRVRVGQREADAACPASGPLTAFAGASS